MSTSSVEVAHEIQTLAGPRGVTVMEAPVSFLAKAPIGASRASPSQSNFLQFDINSVFEAGDYDDGFTLDLVCKDLQLGLDLGARAGIDVAVASLVEQLHQRALQAYGPRSGEMSVVKLYEEQAGALFRT